MKSNSVYKDTAKFSIVVFLLGIIEFIVLSIFFSLRTDIFIGTLYGCIFVCLNFLYLAYSVKKSVEKEENKAKAYMSATYTVRMLLTAGMVIVAAKIPSINIWAAIIPLIFQPIAVQITARLCSHNKGSENS